MHGIMALIVVTMIVIAWLGTMNRSEKIISWILVFLGLLMVGATMMYENEYPQEKYEHEITLVLPSAEGTGTDTVVLRTVGRRLNFVDGFLIVGDKRYPKDRIREIKSIGEINDPS